MQIGQRLRIAREAIGFTLERAAKESGIGASSLSEFENNKREPKFSYLSTLASVYRKTVEFLLTDDPITEETMLWREKPGTGGGKEETEAEFRQLCEQYHRLEVLTNELRQARLPQPGINNPNEFSYPQAGLLAEEVWRQFQLGDRPSSSLRQVLEERFYVKIFHLHFSGSAISTNSKIFGPAILLNAKSKAWRRNYDLAHEFFHLLTWRVFRTTDSQENEPSGFEEKLANVQFGKAGLLLPTDPVKGRIEASAGADGKISFEALDEVAREFGVSPGSSLVANGVSLQ